MLRRKIILITIALTSSLVFFSQNQNSFAFQCQKLLGCPDVFLRPATDTTHTFAIYCCGAESLFSLPSYWQTVWQTGQQSVPEFFNDNSTDKYVFSCDPIGNYPHAIQDSSR